MREIIVAMVTVDRTPQENFLAETLKNLVRGGVWTSEHLNSFHLFDSGGSKNWPGEVLFEVRPGETWIHASKEILCANENVYSALNYAGDQKAKWVLFLEDDIDVCADFIDSVYYWLEEQEQYPLYAFGANYDFVENKKITAWRYPINCFYGTQAIAFQTEFALDFSRFLSKNIFSRNVEGTAYDLIMSAWSKTRWPENKYFLASAPSFVQHIGITSVINPRNDIHIFPSFPGDKWSYRQKEIVI